MNKFSTFNGIKEFIDLFWNYNFEPNYTTSENYNYEDEKYNLVFNMHNTSVQFNMFNDIGERIICLRLYKPELDIEDGTQVSNVIIRNLSSEQNSMHRVYDFDSRYISNQINVYNTHDTKYDIYFDPNTITEEELFGYSVLYGSIFDFSIDCFKQMNEFSESLSNYCYKQVIFKIDLFEYQTKEDFLLPLYNLIQTTIDTIKK